MSHGGTPGDIVGGGLFTQDILTERDGEMETVFFIRTCDAMQTLSSHVSTITFFLARSVGSISLVIGRSYTNRKM